MINDKSYFEVFSLTEQFQLDLSLLNQRHRELQKKFHPDRFASQSDQEYRVALQYSVYINEAFECLSSPLSRAQYLLSRSGMQQDVSHTMSSDPAFLFKQMEWRESLAQMRDADNAEKLLEQLSTQVDAELLELQQQFEEKFNHQEFESAQQAVQKMHFLEKLLSEIDLLEGELLDY